jgi:hypothetical protein
MPDSVVPSASNFGASGIPPGFCLAGALMLVSPC